MANGRVITGYSKPYVALYAVSDSTVTYSGGMALARGVDVSIEPDSGDGNNFYADNVTAESVGAVFNGGTATFTVDGLKDAARLLISGVDDTGESITVGSNNQVKVYSYDDTQNAPYVGVGFVVRYMEAGVTSYVAYMLPKLVFSPESLSAATQEEDIEFQTTELEATIMRDDTSAHKWLRWSEAQTTEAAAEAVVKKLLGITA